MPWAIKRQLLYLGGVLLFLIVVVGVPLFIVFYEGPNCFDGSQNGEELGVDCGGECQRLCPFQADDPTVLFSRSFEVKPGLYNAVAYIENPNIGAGVAEVGYVFTLFDRDNLLVAERRGSTFLSPNRTTPVFEAAIATGQRTPARTFFEFTGELEWFRAEDRNSQLVVRDRVLSNPETEPRVDATLENTSVEEFRDIDVVAVVFGSDGNAINASKTFVELLPRQATQELVFTWPLPFAKRVEACSTPVDVILLLDISGSMNDDGGVPPQPLSDALSAASLFIERLDRLTDQVGVVVFATEAELIQGLTLEHEAVDAGVRSLVIDPKEERGLTNMGDAILFADAELASLRHNREARKIVVLLTDGRANAPAEPGGEPHALERAGAARGRGAVFYTIGLGDGVNTEFLSEIAGAPERVFFAGKSAELGQIYREISSALCERGPAVLDIIARTKDAFFVEEVER